MEQSTTDADLTFAVEQPAPLSQLVIEAVAETRDVDPLDLEPLYNAVDPDALDALFGSKAQPACEPPTGEVSFSYEGYDVRVTAAGRVELTQE